MKTSMSGKSILSLALLISIIVFKSGCNLPTSGRQQAAGSQTKSQVQFKNERGGNGTTKDGNHFSFHVYTSQDGVALLTYIEEYATPELAKRAIDEKAKEASSIIARGPRLNKDGETIGERVVLVEKSQGETRSEPESFICWTTGSRIHWIQSKSLNHALAYEKTLYP
jgi:hypothetical protein